MSSGYSVNNIQFAPARYGSSFRKSEENHFDAQKRKQSFGKINIANMSDNQILFSSLSYAEKKNNETLAGKISNALPMLFFTAIPALFGAMQKGPLSAKVKSGLSAAIVLGGIDFVFKKCDSAKERVENRFPKLKENSEKHPVTSSLADFAIKVLAATALYAGVLKGGKYLQNKFQPSSEMLLKSINKASEKLDSTVVAGKVAKTAAAFGNFKSKHPKAARFFDKNSYLAPLGVILGWGAFSGLVQGKAVSNKIDAASERAELLFNLRDDARKV